MRKIYKGIHIFIGIIRSLFFNIRVFPLKQAIKLPIIISPFVKITSLNGEIILKNSDIKFGMIKKGSIIGANSLIANKFQEENVLILGNPAYIKKRNIYWEK